MRRKGRDYVGRGPMRNRDLPMTGILGAAGRKIEKVIINFICESPTPRHHGDMASITNEKLLGHTQWLESAGKSGRKVDETGMNLAGAMLNDLNLTKAHFVGTTMTKANLAGTNLSQCLGTTDGIRRRRIGRHDCSAKPDHRILPSCEGGGVFGKAGGTQGCCSARKNNNQFAQFGSCGTRSSQR